MKEKKIIELTKSAIEKILWMQKKDKKEGYCLRIGVSPGGCAGLSYEMCFQKKPYDNDITFKQDNITIILNAESIRFLEGLVIEYKETLKESGFQYINPKAKDSCGCGISFHF